MSTQGSEGRNEHRREACWAGLKQENVGFGRTRKGCREKVVGAYATVHKIRHGQTGWRSHWREGGSELLPFGDYIPDAQVRVFGGVPEPSVSNETPPLQLVKGPWEGRGGEGGGALAGLLELTEGVPSRITQFS